MIRIVKNKEEQVDVDLTGKANGRGAYICLNSQCLNEAKKNKKINRALGIEISEDIYQKIEDIINSD